MLNRLSIRLRLALIVLAGAIGLAAFAAMSLLQLHENMIADRREQLRAIATTAAEIARQQLARAEAGEIDLETAQRRAIDAIGAMRFGQGNSEYLFVYDFDGTIVHLPNPDLIGQNRIDLTDADGVQLVRELIAAARQPAGGFVAYRYPRAGGDVPLPKLSFAAGVPEWRWMIGTGLYIDDIEATFRAKMTDAILFGLIVLAVTGAVAYLIARGINRGISGLTDTMGALTDGRLDIAVPYQDQRDEIGTMARAVEVFRKGAEHERDLETQNAEMQAATEAERKRQMIELANRFEASVGEIARTVGTAAEEMQASAKSLSAIAEETSIQAATVSASAEQASANVETVASAAEELGSSIQEISRQMTQQTNAAHDATEAARDSDTQVKALAEQAQEIGEVVSLITSIAEQTNLLALNATIEAARAGDAGKGFSVVAAEVKNLANQTAQATDRIAAQIKAIQEKTGQTVSAIEAINARIERITEIASSVASAVEEQNAATGEISRNVAEAHAGTNAVSQAIGGVSEASRETGENADNALKVAEDLSHQSGQLSKEIREFLDGLRAA